jgi:predicted RNA polymerase sigma factor
MGSPLEIANQQRRSPMISFINDPKELKGRRTLLTGGSRAVGGAIVIETPNFGYGTEEVVGSIPISSTNQTAALFDLDRSQWDQQLLGEGMNFLKLSAEGSGLTEYHVEAAIASVHARAHSDRDTDWKAIVSLYDTLMTLRPSPIVGLNRAIAIAQLEGPERGLEEMGRIKGRSRLVAYPFHFAALGELELRMGRHDVARERFRAAAALARSPMEREFFAQRLNAF